MERTFCVCGHVGLYLVFRAFTEHYKCLVMISHDVFLSKPEMFDIDHDHDNDHGNDNGIRWLRVITVLCGTDCKPFSPQEMTRSMLFSVFRSGVSRGGRGSSKSAGERCTSTDEGAKYYMTDVVHTNYFIVSLASDANQYKTCIMRFAPFSRHIVCFLAVSGI